MIIQQDAPGKLYIAGEYAILNAGSPAIITPVGRKLTITASHPANHDYAHIKSDQFPEQTVHWQIQPNGLPTFKFPSSSAQEKQTFTTSALRTAEEYATAKRHGQAANEPYDLRISSKLDASDGTKLGIGSSAAVTVATIKTALAWHGILPEDPKQATPLIFKLAAIAHLTAQGNGSCGDIAACAAGRLVKYRSFDRKWLRTELGRKPVSALVEEHWPGLSIEPLPERNDIRFLAGWTGTPASTKEFVNKTRRSSVSDVVE
ncbi:MAG: phosphomevalonate kinase, partial [Bifidobacteriaceae bacterium]|nr:phosphomevalonate kinase [Bifidobacteriaceae bacterium]